ENGVGPTLGRRRQDTKAGGERRQLAGRRWNAAARQRGRRSRARARGRYLFARVLGEPTCELAFQRLEIRAAARAVVRERVYQCGSQGGGGHVPRSAVLACLT